MASRYDKRIDETAGARRLGVFRRAGDALSRRARDANSLQNIFIYWAVITLGPLLIGASLSSTYFALRRSLGALQLDLVADALLGVVPFVLTCGALTLLYGVVPARRVEWRHALLGGTLAGLGFEIAKRGFAIYLSKALTYILNNGAF